MMIYLLVPVVSRALRALANQTAARSRLGLEPDGLERP
jgi:hypothetical protein